jgi:hypothetical protein
MGCKFTDSICIDVAREMASILVNGCGVGA